MKSNGKVVAALTLLILCGSLASVLAISHFLQFQNTGQINAVGIAVYQDAACTVPLTSMNWNIDPASSINQGCYLKNIKNSPVTVSMSTSNWLAAPTNSTNILSLTWDTPADTILAPNAVRFVTFTLTAVLDTGSTETFSFDTTITGTKV